MFSTNSKIYHILTNFTDVLYLGVLWTLFSIPIVTIGASTTALYYVSTKKASNRDGTSVFRDFWDSFRSNFMKSTAAFLILTAITLILLYNFEFLYLNSEESSVMLFILNILTILFAIQTLFIFLTIFPIIARFDLSLKSAFITALILSNKHLLLTIGNVVVFLGLLYFSFVLPILIFFFMGIYAYIASFSLLQIFRKNNESFDEYLSE